MSLSALFRLFFMLLGSARPKALGDSFRTIWVSWAGRANEIVSLEDYAWDLNSSVAPGKVWLCIGHGCVWRR